MSIYDKPVRVLMQEMVPSLGISSGQVFTKDTAIDWFGTHYPLIKEGTIAAHLIRLSTNNRNRLHYSARADGSDDVFFQVGPTQFRLYDRGTDPLPIQEGPLRETDPAGVAPTEASSEFAYEHDLRDYLSRNLGLIEPGLLLYSEEGVAATAP